MTISIHAPRVGSDSGFSALARLYKDFNPRSPCGERPTALLTLMLMHRISIHAPRVGSDSNWRIHKAGRGISIHAPRVGSDKPPPRPWAHLRRFQSTLPVWGATALPGTCSQRAGISIHAPRVGSDSEYRTFSFSTSRISIHAPRVGSDSSPAGHYVVRHNFNPRSPCGERPPLTQAPD